MENAQGPAQSRKKAVMAQPSNLTVCSLNDRFFTSPTWCMFRKAFSKHWRNCRQETEQLKKFLLGGRFGRSLLCQGQSRERFPWQLRQYRGLSFRQKQTLFRFMALWKSFCSDTHTHTHTHTQAIKAPWTARSPALAHTWPLARIKKVVLFLPLTICLSLCLYRYWSPKTALPVSGGKQRTNSLKLIPKTIGNRKRDCAWGCARGINTTCENLQIEKHKSVRWAKWTPSWFVLFDLQIFSGGVYPPSATSRTISFSISNSFWY